MEAMNAYKFLYKGTFGFPTYAVVAAPDVASATSVFKEQHPEGEVAEVKYIGEFAGIADASIRSFEPGTVVELNPNRIPKKGTK